MGCSKGIHNPSRLCDPSFRYFVGNGKAYFSTPTEASADYIH